MRPLCRDWAQQVAPVPPYAIAALLAAVLMAVWSSLTSAAWRTADHLWAVLTGLGLLFFYLALLSRCKVVAGASKSLPLQGWTVLDLYESGMTSQKSLRGCLVSLSCCSLSAASGPALNGVLRLFSACPCYVCLFLF